jgi:hypothetical protein
MNARDVLGIVVGVGSGMLCVDGGFALYGLHAAQHLSDAGEQFPWISEARLLFAAIFVEGLFGVAGLVLCIGLVKARTWAAAALPWATGGLAVLATSVLVAMPNTWHHQVPIILVSVFILIFQRHAQRKVVSAT